MLKRILIGTLLFAIVLFTALWSYVAYIWVPDFNFGSGISQTRIDNENWLYEQVNAQTCTTSDDVRAIAAQRDWLVETHDGINWCINKEGLSGWISVTVEPAHFMSTEDENRRYFGFDAQGCSVDWSYGDC